MKRPPVIEIAMFCGVMFWLIVFFLYGGRDFTGISEQVAVIKAEQAQASQKEEVETSNQYLDYLTTEMDDAVAIYENIDTEARNDFFVMLNENETFFVTVKPDGDHYSHNKHLVKKGSALNIKNLSSYKEWSLNQMNEEKPNQTAEAQSEEVADTQVVANPSSSQTSASASSARDNTKQALAEIGKTYLKFKLIQRVFNTLAF